MNRLLSISSKHRRPVLVFLVAVFLLAGKLAAQAPTISSFSPTSAIVGATVTITGTVFNATPANNAVFFGPVKATVTAATTTSLSVTVPAGAAYGPITVVNTATGRSATSSPFFTPAFLPNKPGGIAADITEQGKIGGGVPSRLYALAANDLDNDGKPDIAITSGDLGDNHVYIRRNISTPTSVAFASSVTLTIASGVSGSDGQISFGDIDGDSRPDMVVPGGDANAFVVLKNNSNVINAGNFSPTTVASALNTTGSAISDLDLDGKPDIVVTNYNSSNIMVYPNNSTPGSIVIGAGITMTGTAFQSTRAGAADLDGDGLPEIVVPQSTANLIFFYKNTSTPGAISFNAGQSVTVFTTGLASSISVADLNNDGKPDMVVTDGKDLTANSIAILRNTSSVGSITFSVTTQQIATAPYNQTSASFADINGDGKPDLVLNLNKDFDPDPTPGIYEYRIAVMYNTSVGNNLSFSSPIEYLGANAALGYNMVTSDMNGDGIPDILVPTGNNGNIAVYRGSPQFAPTISSFVPLTAAPFGSVVITGTGFNTTTTNNIVEFGTVTATVTAATATSLTVTVPRNASYAPITVLNRGNTLSAVSPRMFMPAVTPNKPTLAVTDFVEQNIFSVTGDLYGIAAGDLTGDGKPELVVVNSANTGSLIILGNISTIGGPVAFGVPTVFTPTAGFESPRYVSLADMDGNGWLDIVVPSNTLSTVGVFLNSGTGTVSTAITLTGSFETGWSPIGVATGDLDGDGKPEIVTSNDLGANVSVFRNTSTNINAVSFAEKQNYDVSRPNAVFNLALADMDNDGKLDIIAGRDAGVNSTVVFLRNTSVPGSISFDTKVEIAGPQTPWTIVPGDLNGDGLTDLVVGSGGVMATEIFAYTKLSSGGALNNLGTTQLNVLQDNLAVALSDLNGDGKPDVISGNRSSIPGFRTFIYPNTTSGTTTSFGTRLDLPGSYEPWSTRATDLNGDGRPDIVMGNRTGFNGQSTIRIFRNTLVAPPVAQATAINVTALSGVSTTFSWTNGGGAERAVFMKVGNSGSASPVTGEDYTANSQFGQGEQISSTGWFCVFNGTTNGVTVTGLTPSTTYQIMVTEYNDGGLSNTAQYNTNTATGNPITLTTHTTITALSRTDAQLTNANTVNYTLSFGSALLSNPTSSSFTITTSGTVSGATVTGVTGSGTSLTVTVNTGTGNGTVRLGFNAVGAMIPGVTNTLPYLGETYTIDRTAPVLSPVTIVSNNSNTSRARSGDLISVAFTASETISTPVVTIAGQTAAVVNTTANAWMATYTLTGSDPEGTVAFNIAASDPAGNTASATATTNSSSVAFDGTTPTLSPVAVSSNNANTGLARAGNTVTLNFTSSETIVTPVVAIAGHTVTASNSSGNDWTASYTMTGSDAEGAVSFSIAFADPTGNAGSTVTGTTNSSSVQYDITNPTISTATIASGNSNTATAKTGDVVTLNFSSNESITPSVIIAGHTVTANPTGGNNWSASYAMTSTDTEGAIAFSIAYSDASGNAGTTATATTNSSSVVFDRTAPTLSSVTIVSGNTNTSRAKTADLVTLSFTAAESIQSPVVQIAGHTVTPINTSGNAWTASYTMTGTDTEGNIPFSIAFNDLSGNAGTTVTATTNSSSIVFDRTVPALPSVVIVSHNSNTARAKTGDRVTLNFTAAESIQSPVVQIAGHTITPVNTSANAWTASYTMTGTDADGNIPFSIAFNDLSANAGTTVTETTNSSSIIFDRTAPALSSVSIVSSNINTARAKTGDRVTLNFTADETIQTPSVQLAGHTVTPVNTSGNAWTASYTMTGTDADGNVSFSIAFSDLTGNAATTVTGTTNSSAVLFDRIVPTLSSVTILSNNITAAKAKTGDLVTVSFTASEAILTPTLLIATHAITAVNTTGNVWTGSYTMTGTDAEGNVPFSITFSDRSGNNGTTVTASTNSSSVLFDRTVPILSAIAVLSNNPNAGWARAGNRITLNFTASEGVLTPTLSIASHSITPVIASANAWTASYTMTSTDAEGTIPFSIIFTDLAGNEGISVTGTTDNSKVIFDRTIPVLQPVSILSNNTLTQTALPGNEVTLSFTASEGGLTPTVFIAGHAVTAAVTNNNVWTVSVVMQHADTEGLVPFSIIAVDRAGNTTATITATTDNSSVNFIKPNSPYFTNGTVQNLVLCQDVTADISNLLKVTHTANGQPVTITVTGPASHGTLSGFDARLISNGSTVTPAGLSYTPAAGFSGTDAFTMMVTDGMITSTTTINVTVNRVPSGSITSTGTALCAGSVLTLTASGGNSYKWYKDAILINGATGAQFGATAAGTYTAMLASAAGCESPAANSITVTLIQQPKADFTAGTNTCINLSVPFTNTSVTANSGTVDYLWNNGQGQISTIASTSFTFTQAGTYNVKLKITPQLCPALADSISKPVTITQQVAGIRNPSMDVAVSVGTTLQARTLPNATYQWSPARYLVTSNVPNPVTYAAEEQEYLIRLTVPNGCVTIDTLLVRIHQNSTAYLPNVFTPNGDGQNDVLMPTLVGVKQLRYFRIFNRWGKLMFETTNIGIGWNGRYNGVLQPMETYTWSIEGFDSNNVLVKRQGSVTLLR